MADPIAPDRPWSPLGLGVVGATLVLDQVAKYLVGTRLDPGVTIDILPFLALHPVSNPGIAFSFLTGAGSLALIGLTLAVTCVVLWLWVKATEGGPPATVGYALILGGALGNLADRLTHGHVVDFLLLHLGDRTLFIFNLADAALTLGPLLLVALYFLPTRKRPVD